MEENGVWPSWKKSREFGESRGGKGAAPPVKRKITRRGRWDVKCCGPLKVSVGD